MARRAKGEGSLYFDKNRQSWRWHGYYTDSNGIKKFKNFYAKKQSDLKKKVDKFFKQLSEQNTIDKTVSVSQWINIWLESFVKPTVKPTTYEIYKQKMSYVVKHLGSKPLYLVTSLEFQAFINNLYITGGEQKNGLSAATVNAVRRYFKICCNVALENGIIMKNPLVSTKPIRKSKTEIIVLNEEEVKLMLDTAKKGDYIYEGISDPRYFRFDDGTIYLIKCYYTLIRTALSTGMRIGELRGLTWDCINFDKKFIDVKKQIAGNAKTFAFDSPKTPSAVRKIVIDGILLNELINFRKYQSRYQSILGDQFKNYNQLVFTNTFGSPVDIQNFRNRYFIKILKAAKINPNFTIHCMRHTHASLLLKNGANIKVVSERLGHSNVTITLSTYAHIIENMEYSASNIWSNIID